MRPIALSALLAGLVASAPGFAIDGYFVDAGGYGHVQGLRFGMIRQWQQQWLGQDHWHVTGYWETAMAYLHSGDDQGKDVADISFTPVFRLRPDASGGVQPYVDLAVGAHLLSDSKIDSSHDLGSNFQFGPLFGLGLTFGEKSRYDLGYRFQHISNANLAKPNNGLDLHEVRLTYLY